MINFYTLGSHFGVNVQGELEKWIEEAEPTKKPEKNRHLRFTQLILTFMDARHQGGWQIDRREDDTDLP